MAIFGKELLDRMFCLFVIGSYFPFWFWEQDWGFVCTGSWILFTFCFFWHQTSKPVRYVKRYFTP